MNPVQHLTAEHQHFAGIQRRKEILHCGIARTAFCLIATAVIILTSLPAPGASGERARDFGIAPGYMNPGPLNAITDVPGVAVGQVTLTDASKDQFTGVTAILPHPGNLYLNKVPAGYFQGNGYGKMMGISQIIELGEIETPILLTNTLNVADAAIGIIEWTLDQPGNQEVRSVNAVVGETNDGGINDIRRRFVTPTIARTAIETARTAEPVAEGNVGAGNGTVAFGFKAGIGTSSRVVQVGGKEYMLGVLLQANYGGDLHVLGVPVGRLLQSAKAQESASDGSVMIIIATDAPLSDRNLSRLAKRAILGIGRTGGTMSNGSGDYVVAFSTSGTVRRTENRRSTASTVTEQPNNRLTPLFAAVIEATEEAVYNALLAAETRQGRDGQVYEALPQQRLLTILAEHNQLK